MKKTLLYKANIIISILLASSLLGCTQGAAYDSSYETTISTLVKVSDCYEENPYGSKLSVCEETIESYISDDGLCEINVKPSYYEVNLDWESGSHYDVGKAYGSLLKECVGEQEAILESYIYENIHMAFPNMTSDYSIISSRVEALASKLPSEYLDEIRGLSDGFNNGSEGMVEDGKMSYEELLLAQIIPDVLRDTACFGLSVWGDKSDSGNKYTARVLEWQIGSSRQLLDIAAVFNMKNGDKSYTMVGFLGILVAHTGVNDNGVMMGELDVGVVGEAYEYEGKESYIYAIRYCLENFDDADACAGYLMDRAGKFAYNPNILITDKDHSYCVELISNEKAGKPVIRDENTPLIQGYEWHNSDSLCIINGYVSEGTKTALSYASGNYLRWKKMDSWLMDIDKVSLADMKELLTRDSVVNSVEEGIGGKNRDVSPVYNDYNIHIAIYDYETGKLHVAFPRTDGIENRPDFVVVDTYN